jgi:L-rhamnose mutarotase
VFHTALVMQLADRDLDVYRNEHELLSPDVAHAMRSNGIGMAIYYHSGFLFVFATAPSEEQWQRNREDPVFSAWNARMAQLLKTDDKGNILFYSPEKVFGFGELA